MGVPVVSVYFPEIDEFSNIVGIANSYDEFLDKIVLALESDNTDLLQQGITKVASESWEEKYKAVKSKVNDKLNAL